MRINDEQKERAAYVNLPQFLMSHGFDLKKVGKEYVWKEHDSLHIKDNVQGERGVWHRFSTGEGGDNIGFLREFMGMSFVEAVEVLNGEHYDLTYNPSRTYEQKPQTVTARELSLAEADNCRHVFAYLCKTRGLDYDMLSALVKQGVISQEEKTGNVLFKFYDDKGKIIGAEKVGTSTEHRFKGIAENSAEGHGFEVIRGTGESAYFFESAIDMLSYLQMHNKELHNCRLVSMMGLKPSIVLDTMLRYNIQPENVSLCSDNDEKGNQFAERLIDQYPDMKRIITPDTYKDWNDMLRGIPKTVEQENEKKEVQQTTMQTYGNRMWNDAMDNRDKSIVSVSVHDFPHVQEQIEQAGLNYYGYVQNDSVIMAVNDKDLEWFGRIVGAPDLVARKSNRPYSPPEKNIIGNAEYKYIPNKEYISADRDLVLKMAEIMIQRGIKFSGRIYPTGKGTLTVTHDDLYTARGIRDELTARRIQHGAPERGQEVGTRRYNRNNDTYHYIPKFSHEQFSEIKRFLDTNIGYHAVAKDGKVAFAVPKDSASAFHRALENAEREVRMLKEIADIGLHMEQNIALSPVVHRLALEDMKLNLADFFDKRYDDAQFGEMLSLVNEYIVQAPAERYGENSKLNDMLEAKSSFDRAIELSDLFSLHDFSDEQRAAITAMFVGDVSRGQIDSIDETFTVEDIQAYDEILHNALQESDVADFLTAHKQTVIDRENASRVHTEEEVLFPKADLARFLAEHTLSSDEWEDMASPLFERGYLDNHKPNDKAAFGYHLSEPEFYDLAQRYHQDDNIRRELALGLLEGGTSADIEFVFEQGEMSDRTYYYAENLRYSLHLERTDDGYNCTFGGMERFISFEEIGQAFIDRIHDEFNDLAFWWVRDDIQAAVPDIEDAKIAELLTAFDGAAMADWEKGDNKPKFNRIKKALYDILGDEAQTEQVFAIIAKEKYHVTFEPESSIHFDLFGNGITAYDVSRTDPETHDYPTVAHISEEGVVSIYDDTLSEKDMQRIQEQAQSARKQFFERWNRLSTEEQYYQLLNNADMTTSVNITRDHLPMEKAIEKYMPFVFFKEGERPEPEKKGTFQIYQLPGGDKYHGIRFEGMEQLKNDGVQFNKDDYELVYEGEVGEFRDNATLEALFAQFNTNHPEDFRGHSLSVSDVIVISVDGKDTAYFCDSFGFTEMPEFFREKELVQEKPETAKVSDLSVGDVIMYDGARREVEKISDKSISLKDLDAPDYGGILLSTSDVLAYDGWQKDMENKGFEIISKAGQQPEKAEPEDKGPVSLRKAGDFYEMHGKNAEIGEAVLGLQMHSKNGQPMVGFPAEDKDEYSAKLREAGYTVLIEQAFELNPPKREVEKLQTLQQVVDKFFGTDCESAETERDTWKLAIADGDKVGELFYDGDPVCGIYNRGDKMEIEPYRELSTFPKLLQTAMLEHNPDKPVEIMDFQRTFETPLDKAKYLINDFCEAEYRDSADFSDLHNVGLAYTTLTDDELTVQVTADLVDYKISYEFDGEVYSTEQYDSIEDMIENGLTGLDFNELVSVPDEVIDRHTGKDDQTVDLMSDADEVTDNSSPADDASVVETADIDKPLFTDTAVIDEIQRHEKDDVPFWEKPDIEGEQLSLFGDPEPIRQQKPEKPKSEFAKGPVVDGVQVYEALAAEIDRGTGFVHGKLRVQDFYEEKHPTVQQLADFLKKEYGTGGHSGEGTISLVDYNSQGITFNFENGEKYRHSWYNVAVMTESRLRDDTYLSAEQKEERAALKAEQAEPHKVEVGDRFRHSITGEVSEVVSLTGALPFYTDECTITTNKGSYATTENITYDKLLNSSLYEYIGKAEPEKEQSAPMKSEKAEVTPDNSAVAPEAEKPEIPTVKNLSQLKKAIKPGMMFEITDHLRPECIGERRIVTGVSTVDFTSRKLDENGEPTGKDLHMEFDRAKNWTFDGGELTSRLDNGDMLMSFHFIDSLEREQTVQAEKESELAPMVDEVGSDHAEVEAPAPEVTATDKGENFTITDDNLGDGGAKTKFRANVDAIKTLKTLEAEKRPATAEEKETLSKYVGWGALAKAFDKDDPKWAAEYKELSELLTPQEYAQARSTVNDAFYTSPTVIDGIYEALGNFGFDGGAVLEPAMGIGNFFGRMPEDMQSHSQLYGVEIDSLSGRIAQALYPDADIAIQGFEQNRFQNGCFDIAVGNVPFGELGFRDTVHDTTKLHDFFFVEALDNVSVNYG